MAAPTLEPSPVDSQDKRSYVRGIFSDIAPRYDLLNRLLSFRIDQLWRRAAVKRLGWEARPNGTYLDACAGTLDLSMALAGQPGFLGHVIGTDFAVPMLQLGSRKKGAEQVRVAAADALVLPARDGAFDGAMVGFGLRNLSDLGAGFAEFARVLKPGARLVVLDFSVPHGALMRALYLFYFRRVLPTIGRLVSGHPTAYQYLPDSVMGFPAPPELESMMKTAGFSDVGHDLLTGGIAILIWGTR
jgi:demethylmenaquinone methyltransferase/2-methoxy-6-polyprenyl-1,4-benzoquinol methylase